MADSEVSTTSRDKLVNSPLTSSTPSVSTPSYQSTSPSTSQDIQGCSCATLENARYRLGEVTPKANHENEDRHFVVNKYKSLVFGVFDGHDGSRAVGFASNFLFKYFNTASWQRVVENNHEIGCVLDEFVRSTEREFFKSIGEDIRRKKFYTDRIPEVSVCSVSCLGSFCVFYS